MPFDHSLWWKAVPTYRREMEADGRFERLTPRQRECLRLVYNRKKSGQIATALGLSIGTVHGYCSDAVKLLEARDRVDAAEQFASYENRSQAPLEHEVHNSGIADDAAEVPTEAIGRALPDWSRWLPIRAPGAFTNDLGIVARLIWIPVFGLLFAIGFGMLASAVRIVSDLVAGRGAL